MAKQTATKATEVEEQPQTVTAERRPMTLAAKILTAKAKIGKISKDGSAIVEKASGKTIQYATLPQVLSAVVPVLAELGLDYVVAPVWSETTLWKTCAHWQNVFGSVEIEDLFKYLKISNIHRLYTRLYTAYRRFFILYINI